MKSRQTNHLTLCMRKLCLRPRTAAIKYPSSRPKTPPVRSPLSHYGRGPVRRLTAVLWRPDDAQSQTDGRTDGRSDGCPVSAQTGYRPVGWKERRARAGGGGVLRRRRGRCAVAAGPQTRNHPLRSARAERQVSCGACGARGSVPQQSHTREPRTDLRMGRLLRQS